MKTSKQPRFSIRLKEEKHNEIGKIPVFLLSILLGFNREVVVLRKKPPPLLLLYWNLNEKIGKPIDQPQHLTLKNS
jgi:hypothetical protein